MTVTTRKAKPTLSVAAGYFGCKPEGMPGIVTIQEVNPGRESAADPSESL
jgi:hypothetical protein